MSLSREEMLQVDEGPAEIPSEATDVGQKIDDAERQREIEDRAHFNKFAMRYARKDVARSSSLVRRFEAFFALAPLLENGRSLGTVLEIGCGAGATARYLRGRYRRYIGVDHSEKILAAGRVVNGGNEEACLLTANAKNLPLPTGLADVVVLLGALHHMTELDAVLRSLVRVAKPGACLVMREPFRGNPLVQLLRFLRGLLDPAYSRKQHFFSQHELVELLSRHRFWNVESSHLGYLSTPFAEVVVPWQRLATVLSRTALWIDQRLDRYLPTSLRFLAWNIVIRARFPLAGAGAPEGNLPDSAEPALQE